MRVVVVSDTHRDYRWLSVVMKRHRDADYVIFLGDGYEDFSRLKGSFPGVNAVCVRGNCDYMAPHDVQVAGLLTCGPARIFYTHGHIYNVKSGLEELLSTAQEYNANVVLYGHTHIPDVEYHDGIWIMNPGSLGRPHVSYSRTYGLIDLQDEKIYCHLVELEPSHFNSVIPGR